MLKEYTLPIIESHLLSKVKGLIDRLTKYKQQTETILNKITVHRNGLQVMVDGINQLEEENKYKKEHRKLLIDVNQFSLEYNDLKKEIFRTISQALKQQKQKRLLG
jgi:GTP:adenosylcobinamide-phosphate guanylyltransferase